MLVAGKEAEHFLGLFHLKWPVDDLSHICHNGIGGDDYFIPVNPFADGLGLDGRYGLDPLVGSVFNAVFPVVFFLDPLVHSAVHYCERHVEHGEQILSS